MKNILVLPSWYPTNFNPILGIYFKEQIEGLQELDDLQMNVLHVEYLGLHRLKQALGTDSNAEGIENGVHYLSHVYINWFPKLKFLKDRFFSYKTKKYYKKLIKKTGKPDLLHAHVSFPAGYQTYLLSKEFNIPFIVTEHATFFQNELLMRFRPYTLEVLRKADYYVAVSSFLRDKIIKAGRHQCDVLPNFIDIKKFEKSIDKSRFNEDVFSFLNVTDMSHKKGIDILLHALQKVVFELKRPDIHLHLIGEGEKEAELKQLVHQLSLNEYCTFHGRIDYAVIPEYFNSSNALVISSRMETFGIVGIEALACGIPVIATKCEGPEDYITSKNGILVEKEDVDGLAKGMVAIINNYKKYNSLEIKESVKKNYSKEVVTQEYHAIYEKVISRK